MTQPPCLANTHRPREASPVRTLIAAFIAFVLLACDSATLDPLPLDIRLEAAPPTSAPGDTITFLVTAQGGRLLGIVMQFGDGTTQQQATGGARTARLTFRHAYASAGVYEAAASATDALAGDRQATVTIRVQ